MVMENRRPERERKVNNLKGKEWGHRTSGGGPKENNDRRRYKRRAKTKTKTEKMTRTKKKYKKIKEYMIRRRADE